MKYIGLLDVLFIMALIGTVFTLSMAINQMLVGG